MKKPEKSKPLMDKIHDLEDVRAFLKLQKIQMLFASVGASGSRADYRGAR